MNITPTEAARLDALRRYEILDTPPDRTMDKFTSLAARIFNTPIAIISLVDTERIWFKSHYGLDIPEIGREPGLCASAIMSDDVYVVEEARTDPRAFTNALVAGDFGLQFYAAAPLHTQEGHNLGTLCVIDKRRRYLNNDQQLILRDMANLVMEEIEFRFASRKALEQASQRIHELERSASATQQVW